MSLIDIAKSAATGSPVDVLVALVDDARSRTPDARLDQAFQEQINEICLQLAREWSEEKHRNKQPPLREDVEKGALRLADAYHEARDHKKRRILYQAFHSYFRPDFYDDGISEVLWEKIQDLEYPDLVFLAKVIEKTNPEERTSQYFESAYEGGRGKWRGDQLPIYESSEEAECADRLSHRGLVSVEASDSHGVLLVSWRGVARKLKDFALKEFWKEGSAEEPKNSEEGTK